ncbi:hypothetical protein [Mariniblastus fucicola]|uniref:hypothetical protein n=1 Tax=Mariniblastus fucicola TaxID=980251 RepID=UPI001EE4C5DF|nr:hypothetical protein [Mariniblastus fucicola]
MIVGSALFGTPVACASTDTADFFREFSASGHQSDAEFTEFGAFKTARRAIVAAGFRYRLAKAILAIDDALLTGVDTGLEFIHGSLPLKLAWTIRTDYLSCKCHSKAKLLGSPAVEPAVSSQKNAD